MLALIEMNLLPGGKRGGAKKKRGPSLPSVDLGKVREALRADPLVLAVVLIAIGAVGHTGYAFVNQTRELSELNERYETAQRDSVRYAELIASADSLRARRDTLLQKVRIIRGIDQDRYIWPHIMDEVAGALPEFTWLTGLEQTSGSGSEIQFRIQGMTGLTQALTRFMRNLNDSPFIRDIQLVSQQQQQQAQKLVQSFQLLARYEVPDSSAIVTEPIIVEGE